MEKTELKKRIVEIRLAIGNAVSRLSNDHANYANGLNDWQKEHFLEDALDEAIDVYNSLCKLEREL